MWVLQPRSQTAGGGGESWGNTTTHSQFSGWSSFQNFNACYNIAKINLSHMTSQMCVLKTITVLYGKVCLDSAEVVVLYERWLLVDVNSQPEPTRWEQSEAACWFWEAKSTVSYDLQNHLLIYMNRST